MSRYKFHYTYKITKVSKALRGKSKSSQVREVLADNSKAISELRKLGYFMVTRIIDKKSMHVGTFAQWCLSQDGYYRVCRITDHKEMNYHQFMNWYNAQFRYKPNYNPICRIKDRKEMQVWQFNNWLRKQPKENNTNV